MTEPLDLIALEQRHSVLLDALYQLTGPATSDTMEIELKSLLRKAISEITRLTEERNQAIRIMDSTVIRPTRDDGVPSSELTLVEWVTLKQSIIRQLQDQLTAMRQPETS